jgi:lysophospholipase L1-like esterase
MGEDFLHRPSYFLYELALHTRSDAVTNAARSLYPPPLDVDELAYHEKNYRDMAYIARGYGIRVIFMTQPAMPGVDSNDEVNRSTQRIGDDVEVPVFDLAAVMPRDYEHFLADGVHYTERGNAWIARQLAEWLVGQDLLR